MLAPIMWVGRGLVWGLSSLGLVKATETVTAATGGDTGMPKGPSWLTWGLLALAAFALWKLVFKGGAA